MSIESFYRDKSVLITGASSGIGEELAVQLAAAGAKLILAARRREQLEALAEKIARAGDAKSIIAECDVTRDGDLERAVETGVRAWGKLDVAIANAGFGVVGPLKNLTIDDYRRQFETNVFGVLRTIYAALPELEKTRGNLVINGSVASYVASLGGSPYAMSKFALRGLAKAITPELRRVGVKVTLLSPGFIVSNIRRVDNAGMFHPNAKDRAPRWIQVRTDRAVREILRAIARGKREQIVTFHGKVLVKLERFQPWLIRALNEKFVRRPRQ
ncbi:MAG TPA: SDR family NAD(P)-dependent oxidoreductase [Candidatus Acidoferrales bacterium]|nr:SDR family NAD(P)-dependent oxidoreductase [Candidatus Acidoferrales bacterium]